MVSDPPPAATTLEPEPAASLRALFARHPEIAVVYLFGSVARGAAAPGSDLDLGIVFGCRGETARQHQRLLARLAADVAAIVGHERIDLVVLEPQGPIFAHRVLLEGRCLYEGDRERRVDFESETYVRAFDFRPIWERATRGKAAALRQWLQKTHDLR